MFEESASKGCSSDMIAITGAEPAAETPFGRFKETFAMTHIASIPFVALFGQMAARAWRVFNNRRHVAELKYWSDEQLKDIGLTRSDVRRALALPFYRDPTSLLSNLPDFGLPMHLRAANTAQEKPALTLIDGCDPKSGQIAA
jgi:uncharacterized protein YjiS (DUF1127 family)